MNSKSKKLVGLILIGIGGFLIFSTIISILIADRSFSEEGNWTGDIEENDLMFLIGVIMNCIWFVPFFAFGVYFIKNSKKNS